MTETIAIPTTFSHVCTYQLHPTGIHELKFANHTHTAADAYIEYMTYFIRLYQTKPHEVLRVLLDESLSGLMPLGYLMPKLRQLVKDYPIRPPSRTAFLVQNGPIVRVVDTMFQLMKTPREQARYFDPTQREQAIQWLLT
ncbi:MAG: hypothetical protein MUF87_10505 [Anaerolineae bacterium]|jgi:hypothetical protein|nr:hypothetical protein [Anaerolineae bacterium]